jgi:hypothetical protein
MEALKSLLGILVFLFCLLLSGHIVFPQEFHGSVKPDNVCMPDDVLAESSLFRDDCVAYVLAQSNHQVVGDKYYNCAINGLDLPGHRGKQKFIVGRSWLIFPIWKEEEVCVVVREAASINNLIKMAKIERADFDSRSNIIDNSFRERDGSYKHRITFVLEILPKRTALDSMVAQEISYLSSKRRRLYDPQSTGSTEIFIAYKGEGTVPYVVCHIRFQDKISIKQLRCNESDLQVIYSKDEQQLGLTPAERKDIAHEFAEARAHEYVGQSRGFNNPDIARSAIFDTRYIDEKTIEATKPREREYFLERKLVAEGRVVKAHGLTTDQHQLILREQLVLQWGEQFSRASNLTR